MATNADTEKRGIFDELKTEIQKRSLFEDYIFTEIQNHLKQNKTEFLKAIKTFTVYYLDLKMSKNVNEHIRVNIKKRLTSELPNIDIAVNYYKPRNVLCISFY